VEQICQGSECLPPSRRYSNRIVRGPLSFAGGHGISTQPFGPSDSFGPVDKLRGDKLPATPLGAGRTGSSERASSLGTGGRRQTQTKFLTAENADPPASPELATRPPRLKPRDAGRAGGRRQEFSGTGRLRQHTDGHGFRTTETAEIKNRLKGLWEALGNKDKLAYPCHQALSTSPDVNIGTPRSAGYLKRSSHRLNYFSIPYPVYPVNPV